MRDGPEAGLQLVEEILASGQLDGYHLVYADRADLFRRLAETEEARTSYKEALELVRLKPEVRSSRRRFLYCIKGGLFPLPITH